MTLTGHCVRSIHNIYIYIYIYIYIVYHSIYRERHAKYSTNTYTDYNKYIHGKFSLKSLHHQIPVYGTLSARGALPVHGDTLCSWVNFLFMGILCVHGDTSCSWGYFVFMNGGISCSWGYTLCSWGHFLFMVIMHAAANQSCHLHDESMLRVL